MDIFIWDVITQFCLNFNNALAEAVDFDSGFSKTCSQDSN